MEAKNVVDLEKFELKHGSHSSFEAGACAMELVSYMAGEPWSDRPECACPVLTAFTIRLNDRMDDATRQKLKPVLPKLLGSRSDNPEVAKKRARFLAHWACTVSLPILTDALELSTVSEKLRSYKQDQLAGLSKYCYSIKPEMREAAVKAAKKHGYAADADAYADAYADAAAYADADADAAAYAYAAAADAAADAYAAYAAYAYAYAYADADAYAYAAAAAADKTGFWKSIRLKTWDSAIQALDKACGIR